jgi:hypothetical protein
MLIDSNYRILEAIPEQLLSPIVEACKTAGWDDGNYDRFEKPLKDGKLIEFPMPIARREQNYTVEQKSILAACRALLEWIMLRPQFAGYKWIRGEVATLLPGVELGWHKDPQWFHDNCVRLHVPIITNDQCVQLWEGQEFHMSYGYLYELNNRVMHSARNAGHQPRTHLILDLMPEEQWRKSREEGVNPVALVDAPGEY